MTDFESVMEKVSRLGGINSEALEACMCFEELHNKFEKKMEAYYAQYNLSKIRFLALETLYFAADQEMCPAEIADESNITRASMTALLDGLEKLGHIKRHAHPNDRRKVIVKLTPEGRRFMNNALPLHYSRKASLFENLKKDELMIMTKLAQKASNNVKYHTPEPTPKEMEAL